LSLLFLFVCLALARSPNVYTQVDFERVPDLVEKRKVFLRGGKAFLPLSEQQSLIFAEFSANLEAALEVFQSIVHSTESQRTAKALPRLDEDDRLVPILNHLSLGFTAPEYMTSSAVAATVDAANIDQVPSTYWLNLMLYHSWSSITPRAPEICIKLFGVRSIFAITVVSNMDCF